MADCTWPVCLPDTEQDRLCASIDASMNDQPDPHPYAGNPGLCVTECVEKTLPDQPQPDPFHAMRSLPSNP